ncbi:IST1 like protein [Termitomyces sp. T112]|nr:hypothetical protein C0989_007922 [Termitomyces sp. Mn162]KAG5731040.1 IST1 like protein [Termitomyces sp. T112]
MPPWNAPKTKVQLRLSVQRLRTLQQKKEAQAKATRREIATVLEKGKIETARIKVEALIHEDIHTELLELLELYCELLLARFGLLDQNSREPDIGIKESVCNIIYSAPRTELKELHVLRDILMHKYGRDFSITVMDNRDGCVSERVMRKLDVATPSSELVDAYLHEIAKGYNVNWSPSGVVEADQSVVKDPDFQAETTSAVTDRKESKERHGAEQDTKPGEPQTEGGLQKAKDGPVQPPPYSSAAKSGSGTSRSSPEVDSDFDALMKRFKDLKKT